MSIQTALKNTIERFKASKSKTRVVLTLIFAVLLIWAVFSMIETYVSGLNLKHGFLEVSGRIEGYEYHASTKVAGKVMEMFVEEGDLVQKGQPIGKISSKQIQAEYEAAVAKWNFAETEFNHYSKLNKKNAVAKIDYDRVLTNYEVAKENLNQARATLEDTTILAPVTGRVVTKIVRVGEVIGAGTPLVTVINMDDLYLKVFLATDYAGQINLGDEAKVFPDAMIEKEYPAVVNKIAQKAQFTPKNVETKSQRTKLVFEIKLKITNNNGHELKPGMPASGVIKIKKDASWSKYHR